MAAPVYSLSRDFFAYTSDDTNVYEIATTDENGVTINGGTAIGPGTNPTYPRGWKVRTIHGAYLDSGSNIVYRTKVPILDPTNAKWVGGTTTFSKGGQTFVIEGRVGERRTYKGG